MRQWYRGLAKVPNVGYSESSLVDRSQLPGHDHTPTVHHGLSEPYLMWPTADGSTSASPAQSWRSEPRPGESKSQAALRQMHESLELPGTASDYHFAIQACHEELWKHRRAEPWVWAEIESLCWLDIRLAEAQPEFVTFRPYPDDGNPHYIRIVAYQRLVQLYEREGYLHEAYEVAARGDRFQQTPDACVGLRERLAALEAE